MYQRDPARSLAETRHEFGEHGGVNMSVEASTTFTVMEPDTMPEIFAGAKGPDKGGCYLYGRHFNPTVYNLGRLLAALEGTEAAYCTSSGMAAISAALLTCCNAGDHIVSSHTIYGGTYALLRDFLPAKANITATLVDINDEAAVRGALRDETRVIYCESLSNPTLRLPDIPRLAALAQSHGATLIVDNTFAPMVVSPADLGADVVVHSMTKFIGGASDIIAGAICGDEAFITQLMDLQLGALMLLGPTMDPKVAFELSTRLPHLPLRMSEHSRRALAMAERLHALGLDVVYPGLPCHPDHRLARELCRPEYGFGGVLALDAGTTEKANELMARLQNEHSFGYMAVSLGYYDTLMSCSGSSTSSELTEADKTAAGIAPGLIRLSVGYTGALDQRLAQLEAALRHTGMV